MQNLINYLRKEDKMSHLQAHVDGELLKEVKKIAIDQDVHVKDYVQKALRTQLELDKAEGKETTNKPIIIEEKEK
jgi:hypothetical protein